MAMTLSTLRSLTRQLIGDPQGSTYSPDMYQDAINFACKEYAKKTGVTYVETAVTMDTYTGLCTIPTAYMRINRVLVGGALSYGVYVEDIDPKSAVALQSYGYPIRGNCILFPTADASMTIKPETVTVMNEYGNPVSTASSTALLGVATASPAFSVSSNEKCYTAGPLGSLGSSRFVDFTVIGMSNGISGEIKLRYIELAY